MAAKAAGNPSCFDGQRRQGAIMHGVHSRLIDACARKLTVAVALATLALASSAYPRSSLARPAGEESFSSPEQASRALFLAVKGNDEPALTHILGAEKGLVSSEDEVQDQREREQFVHKYQQMHRLARQADGAVLLYIGAENWPFPVPLVSSEGAWHFDATAGLQEVLLRRIGQDELEAIQVCHALALAGQDGSHVPPDQQAAVTALLVKLDNGAAAVPFRGYDYRRLDVSGQQPHPQVSTGTASGRTTGLFAFLAYPDKYRSSGLMTFGVDGHGIVYEKDLGPGTAHMGAVTEVAPDATWHRVDAADTGG
jgi:hypothetical protein